MYDTRPSVESKTLSLYPAEWAAFWEIAKDHGLASMSAAVRFVLNDFIKSHSNGNGDHHNEA